MSFRSNFELKNLLYAGKSDRVKAKIISWETMKEKFIEPSTTSLDDVHYKRLIVEIVGPQNRGEDIV